MTYNEATPINLPDYFAHGSIEIEAAPFRRILAAALVSVGKDTTRPNLCGVLLRFAGEYVETVGTDGHRLGMYRAECLDRATASGAFAIALGGAPVMSALLDRPTVAAWVKALAPACKKVPDFTRVRLGFAGRKAVLTVGTSEYTATMPTEQFPPFERVIPAVVDGGDHTPVAFDPGYLGDIGAIGHALGMTGSAVFRTTGQLDPCRVDFVEGNRVLGVYVVMPMRVVASWEAFPAFQVPTPAPVAAAPQKAA